MRPLVCLSFARYRLVICNHEQHSFFFLFPIGSKLRPLGRIRFIFSSTSGSSIALLVCLLIPFACCVSVSFQLSCQFDWKSCCWLFTYALHKSGTRREGGHRENTRKVHKSRGVHFAARRHSEWQLNGEMAQLLTWLLPVRPSQAWPPVGVHPSMHSKYLGASLSGSNQFVRVTCKFSEKTKLNSWRVSLQWQRTVHWEKGKVTRQPVSRVNATYRRRRSNTSQIGKPPIGIVSWEQCLTWASHALTRVLRGLIKLIKGAAITWQSVHLLATCTGASSVYFVNSLGPLATRVHSLHPFGMR